MHLRQLKKNLNYIFFISMIFIFSIFSYSFASMKSPTLISDYGIIASTGTFSGNTFLATTNGNVGIGTVTPSSKLEVVGSIKASSFTFNSSQYVNKISTDTTLSSNLDTSIPTEKAVKGYVDTYSYRRFAEYFKNTQQTSINIDTVISFDSEWFNNTNGLVSISNYSSGNIQLAAGYKYRLSASVGNSWDGYWAAFQWYVNGTGYIGQGAIAEHTPSPGNTGHMGHQAVAYVTANVATSICLKKYGSDITTTRLDRAELLVEVVGKL